MFVSVCVLFIQWFYFGCLNMQQPCSVEFYCVLRYDYLIFLPSKSVLIAYTLDF